MQALDQRRAGGEQRRQALQKQVKTLNGMKQQQRTQYNKTSNKPNTQHCSSD